MLATRATTVVTVPAEQPDLPDRRAEVRSDGRESWPAPTVVDGWLGDSDVDFEFRPGEDVAVHDDPEAQAAALRFRSVLGRFASGITVVTATNGDEPVGMTCQSFSSVSLDPPLVLFVPARSSRAWPMIQRSGGFCVNVLGADQQVVSDRMATRGIDKFKGVSWHPSPHTGSPVIDDCLAHLDCTIHAVHPGGDHFVVIGEVIHLEAAGGAVEAEGPLLYYRGNYRAGTT